MKRFFILLLTFGVLFQLSAATNWYAEKFPKQLVDAAGKPVSASSLRGKMVAVYFSASWCGPCRNFTPKLVKFYKRVAKKSNIEIVFVSSDNNRQAMRDYMKKNSMPWLAIPYNASERMALKKALRVNGIPTLIVFDANGKIISSDARWDVEMLEEKAVKAWQSPNYKPRTYQDYRNKKSIKAKRNPRIKPKTAKSSCGSSCGTTKKIVRRK